MMSVFRYYINAKAIRFKFIIYFVNQQVFMHTNISETGCVNSRFWLEFLN